MKRLFMDFVNPETGDRRRITLNSPKENLTAEEVQNVMEDLIAYKVIPLSFQIDRAAIVETNTNEFFDLIQ